jgi:hypothetical protein
VNQDENANRSQDEQNDPDGEPPDDIGEHGEIV